MSSVQLSRRKLRAWAEDGECFAQLALGLDYAYGDTGEKDCALAIKWLSKAAERGQPVGQFHLGLFYERGEGIEKDLINAAKWYRLAAEGGLFIAQVKLAYCYYRGIGVQLNTAEAARWFLKAATQGAYLRPSSQSRISAEAVHLFRKALSQLKAGAQTKKSVRADEFHEPTEEDFRRIHSRLTLVLEKKRDGTPKIDMSANILLKQAKQGNVRAQYILGLKYLKGEGVPMDKAEAYSWFNLAAVSSKNAKAQRDRLVRQLSPSARQLAERRSTNLFKQIEARKKAGK